jgi:hypothetical protein
MDTKDTIIAGLQVDINILQERVKQVTRERDEARNEVRRHELGTQTMRKLQILGEDDGGAFDPRETGAFPKDIWERTR